MQTITVTIDYLAQLEAAVQTAEWWLADIDVARRKDQRGERLREVFKAADAVRARQRGEAA